MILEYLEDTQAPALHPADPLARAEHRAWIEFGSAILNDIAGLYAAADAATFSAKVAALRAKFSRAEDRLKGPWFDGERFSLVDAVFGPVFRYFDAFDRIGDFGILSGLPKVAAWRRALASRANGADRGRARIPCPAVGLPPRTRLAFVAADGGAARRRISSLDLLNPRS